MKDIIYTSAENFNIKKNYKLFRLFQNIVNRPFNKNAKYEDTDIELEDRIVKVRVFNNFSDGKTHKLIIFLHGGGWVAGSLSSYTNVCYNLSNETDCIVALIEYRLAPEHPFPAGFDDCYGVIKTIYQNVKQINLNTKDIIVMGDSAGGNIAAAVAQKALNTKDFKIDKQVLFYPALQTDYSLTTKYDSVLKNGYDYLITRKQLNDFLEHYVQNKKDLTNEYVAPLLGKKVFGLPKTLIFVCSEDPLCDEGVAYHKKLRRHLVYSQLRKMKGPHGYLTNVLEKKNTNESYRVIKSFIDE